MVRAGVKVGENSVAGARSVVQSDVPAHHVVVGQPAKSVSIKPGWESVAEPVDADHENGRDGREIPYELPDDFEVFDEFQRDREPPDG
jgi:maltose O-acetyltransferase